MLEEPILKEEKISQNQNFPITRNRGSKPPPKITYVTLKRKKPEPKAQKNQKKIQKNVKKIKTNPISDNSSSSVIYLFF